MLRNRIAKNRAARQLEPKVLHAMRRSLESQLAGFRGTRSTDELSQHSKPGRRVFQTEQGLNR